jgi:hypothetical protein
MKTNLPVVSCSLGAAACAGIVMLMAPGALAQNLFVANSVRRQPMA